MCGRYYIEVDDRELQDICEAVTKRQNYEKLTIKTSGEIFPSDTVPVVTAGGDCRPMKWGFSGYDGKLIINARSETALTKPTFRNAALTARCLIPASGYYEWQKTEAGKVKYAFCLPGSPVMYLAGCYRMNLLDPVETFVIFTRPAVAALRAIHDRMPVIIPSDSAERWLSDSPDMSLAACDLLFSRV